MRWSFYFDPHQAVYETTDNIMDQTVTEERKCVPTEEKMMDDYEYLPDDEWLWIWIFAWL